ncbi:MAG TPA: ferrous iron transport protein A [Candidatus Scatomorpha merdipullorum]|uniref:Ferrous iron transport protein A n=1 Tax=Candidatus Scatomorpha merdipullorum TaxID=2840927 RepID=A0A9D1FCQ9_9FIRM|nr:ferrous iron transport protein A [Candidatus Scatomorpha merdipullorum]
MYLKDIPIGGECVVESMDLPFELERRLEALGMTTGTRVSVLNRKGKGIMIIKLRGTRFALGYNITRNIKVREAEGNGE